MDDFDQLAEIAKERQKDISNQVNLVQNVGLRMGHNNCDRVCSTSNAYNTDSIYFKYVFCLVNTS